MRKSISCTIMRGGTSKGIFFAEDDLPPAGEERDRILLGNGLVEDWEKAPFLSPSVPKMTLVTGPKTYRTYALTGVLRTGAAALVRGSVVNRALGSRADISNIRIGHPDGIIEAGVSAETTGAECRILSVTGYSHRPSAHGRAGLFLTGPLTVASNREGQGC
ncbi:MAG: PrpF domain-containing protein [Desulfatiglandaceae bacterium]